MSLGERIRQTRMEKGLTQSQLAGDMITRNMLSQIENGAASPSMKTLGYLAQTLGVSVGYLMEEEDTSVLRQAKALLKKGAYSDAAQAAECSGACGDEYELLLTQCYCAMAMDAFYHGASEKAVEYARQALSHEAATVYHSQELKVQMQWLLAKCSIGTPAAEREMDTYRAAYENWGWEAKHHLLAARYFLSREQTQLAEREIWTITALPEEEKANYLLLRGWLAIRQEKYSNAVSFLKQVEQQTENPVMRKELYGFLEIAYRELEEYKSAYEYAARQREM